MWNVSECLDCSLGFLNPRPTWDELQPYYSDQYGAYAVSHGATASDADVVRAAELAGTFRHIPIPAGKRVLDVGCGGGYFLRICSKLGATVQGIEPSHIAAELARGQGISVFNGMPADFETNERFDIVTCNQVLEHVPDPVAALTKVKSLLAPGGMIWISVPNNDSIWAKRLSWRWDGCDLPYHLLHFGPQSLGVAARRSGLSIKRLYTSSVPWIVAYSMQKHLRYRYRIPQRLSSKFYTAKQGATLGRRLDAVTAGDNLIAELTV